MASSRLTSGVKYSVVGRYMTGSTVSGYHLLGDDDSQVSVPKSRLIYLVGQGVVSNCRVQMFNNSPLLRGKGINLQYLPIYDETRKQMKNTQDTNGVKPKNSDPNSVFGQLTVLKRIMCGNACVGYLVQNAAGVQKRLSRGKVIEMATERQIGNARAQKCNDGIILRGVGIELDKLPTIYVDRSGKDIPSPEYEVTPDRDVTAPKITHSTQVPTSKQVDRNPAANTAITVSKSELGKLGSRKMELNRDISSNIKGVSRMVGVPELKDKSARIYIQLHKDKSSMDMDEYVSTNIKFGDVSGVLVRMVNRVTKEVIDIKELTIRAEDLKEKIVLGIVSCGLLNKYKNGELGIISIQANDASSERAYELGPIA